HVLRALSGWTQKPCTDRTCQESVDVAMILGTFRLYSRGSSSYVYRNVLRPTGVTSRHQHKLSSWLTTSDTTALPNRANPCRQRRHPPCHVEFRSDSPLKERRCAARISGLR